MIVEKIDDLAAKIGDLANACGRDVEHVFDEIIAYVESKKADAEKAKAAEPEVESASTK